MALLYRLKVIRYFEPRPTIQLLGLLPLGALCMLCSTPPAFVDIDFICDVAILLSHMPKIRLLLSHMTRISRIRVRYHPDRLCSQKKSLEMGTALAEFLVLASSYGCRLISIESNLDARTEGVVDKSWFSLASYAALADWHSAAQKMAASDVNCLHLATSMFSCPQLLTWSLSMSGSTMLRSLVLDECPGTPPHYNKYLPNLTLPSLRALTIRGIISMDDLVPFLYRHLRLELLELKSDESVVFPLYHAHITLELLTVLSLSCEYVEPFLSIIDTPRLLSMKLFLRDGSQPYQAFEALSAHPRLHAIAFRLMFDDDLLYCIPNPISLPAPELLDMTALEIHLVEPILEDAFVSQRLYC
jgi:hypothetical protein